MAVKLSEKDALEIKVRLTFGEKQVDLAREFGVNQSTISRIKNNQRWKVTK